MLSHRSLLAVGAALSIAAACGGSSKSGDDDEGGAESVSGNNAVGSNGVNIGNASSGSSGSGGPTGVGGTNADGCAPAPDDEGCVGTAYEGENIPLDIFIMFDQSCSMSCPIEQGGPGQCCCQPPATGCSNQRIDPVRSAVNQFLEDPLSAGIGAGIGFFGYYTVGDTSCDPADYARAAVPIAQLPGNASQVAAALNAVLPTGETPTDMAIQGACDYLNAYHDERPGSKKVILLVTDGVPETPQSDCDPSVEGAARVAQECLNGNPNIETYVLGVGQALDSLNAIAEAGGTERAYLVESGDVAGSVLEALNAIRADASIPCSLPIPPPPNGGALDYNKVNLGICNAAGDTVATSYVPSADDCQGAGNWYYEDTASGRNITLCDATCDTVTAAGAKLFFNVGCTRVDDPDIE